MLTAIDKEQTGDVAAALRATQAGLVIGPPDAGFEQARRVWNGMVDRRPLAVVRCASNTEVAATIAVARDRGVPLAIRGGGHSLPGFSSCDGGIVLDLSPMRHVWVDVAGRRAVAEGGCTWADYDSATQEHGLASTGGLVSTTGLGGLTLGGGIGWLTRAHGLACDNLISAEVVTASGEIVRASAEQHEDLFWGLRGGGGNFGVVTGFEFAVHPVGEVTAALLLWPYPLVEEVSCRYRDWVEGLSDEFTTMLVFMTGPEMEDVPESLRGELCVGVAGCHIGAADEAARELEPMEALAGAVDLCDRVGYRDLQQMFDADFPAGRRYYFTDTFFDDLPDRLVNALARAATERPSAGCEIDLHHMGGASARVAASSTAFTNRAARFTMNAFASWDDPRDDDAHRDWARALRATCEPFAASRGYVNFASEVRSADAVRATYGDARYERLAEVKRRWDPDNLFQLNQNIQP